MNVIKVPISDVLPWDKNPRGIKTKDFDRLKKQITDLGEYKPLVAFKKNGKYVVLGGNMRLKAYQDMGVKEVSISIVDAPTTAKQIKFALSDNDRAGYYEEDKLAELVYPEIANLDLGEFKVDLGEAIDLKQVVERYGPDIDDGADDVPEVDDTPALTRMGDLFTLGKHRLLCGDSTKAEDVARLMRGEKASLVFADPPYGMGKLFENDSLGGDDLELFNEKWMAVLPVPNDAIFVCFHSPRLFWTALDAARKSGWTVGRYMTLYKPNDMTFPWHGWLGVSESILLFYRGKPKFNTERPSDTSFWHDTYSWTHKNLVLNETASDRQKLSHPSIKPIPVCADLIWKTSLNGDVAFDPFLGSGTTLIATEKTGRVCYGMEIDPKYCDVIIKRYCDYVHANEDAIRATREANG